MNSKFIKNIAVLALLGYLTSDTNNQNVAAIRLDTNHKMHAKTQQGEKGIFGRMIDQALAPQRLAQERAEASKRKQKQLDEAQREYDQEVAQQEAEELAQKKKVEEEAEKAALEAAQHSPQAKLLAAANEAASNINVSEMEANIQAQLQAKIDAGASKSDLLASIGQEESSFAQQPAVLQKSPVDAQSVVAQVLAQHKQKDENLSVPLTPSAPFRAPAPAPAEPTTSLLQKTAPQLAAPITPIVKPQALAVVAPEPVAALQVKTMNTASAEAKASQEKVKEMAVKLGVPFTNDLMALGSNSAISDALIEKAVAAGKSEAQINAAMASL